LIGFLGNWESAMTPVTPEQTEAILALLAQGMDRDTIAYQIGVAPAQVSAVKAVANRGKRQTDISTDEVIGDAIETSSVLNATFRNGYGGTSPIWNPACRLSMKAASAKLHPGLSTSWAATVTARQS